MSLIAVENRSSVVGPRDFYNACWALAYQLAYQYGRSQWVKLGLAPTAGVRMLDGSTPPPPGAYHMVLLDDSSEAGTLGFHENDSADIFCKTALDDGVQFSAVMSHEAMEYLVDPDVTKVRTVKHNGKLWIVEVGDPVEGNDYDVGAPEGRRVGVTVSDFAEPSWFGLDSRRPYSYRQSVKAAFKVAPGGFISVAPLADPENWTQVFGEARQAPPKDYAARRMAAGSDVS